MLSGYIHDIFVREAVLAVGVGKHFYGFSTEKQQNLKSRKKLYSVRCSSYELSKKG